MTQPKWERDLAKGHRKLLKKALVRRLVAGEKITMKEIRAFMVAFLARHQTFSLCSDCPEYKGPRKKLACCYGCPNLDIATGCASRNTNCLSWSCGSLRTYLEKRNAWWEFQAMGDMFRELDTRRGGRLIGDRTLIKLHTMKPDKWEPNPRPTAVPVHSKSVHLAQKQAWGYAEGRAAHKAHSEFVMITK